MGFHRGDRHMQTNRQHNKVAVKKFQKHGFTFKMREAIWKGKLKIKAVSR